MKIETTPLEYQRLCVGDLLEINGKLVRLINVLPNVDESPVNGVLAVLVLALHSPEGGWHSGQYAHLVTGPLNLVTGLIPEEPKLNGPRCGCGDLLVEHTPAGCTMCNCRGNSYIPDQRPAPLTEAATAILPVIAP